MTCSGSLLRHTVTCKQPLPRLQHLLKAHTVQDRPLRKLCASHGRRWVLWTLCPCWLFAERPDLATSSPFLLRLFSVLPHSQQSLMSNCLKCFHGFHWSPGYYPRSHGTKKGKRRSVGRSFDLEKEMPTDQVDRASFTVKGKPSVHFTVPLC